MKALISTITTTTAGLDTVPVRAGAGAIFASRCPGAGRYDGSGDPHGASG